LYIVLEGQQECRKTVKCVETELSDFCTGCSVIKLRIRNTSHQQFTQNLKITILVSILKKLDLNSS